MCAFLQILSCSLSHERVSRLLLSCTYWDIELVCVLCTCTRTHYVDGISSSVYTYTYTRTFVMRIKLNCCSRSERTRELVITLKVPVRYSTMTKLLLLFFHVDFVVCFISSTSLHVCVCECSFLVTFLLLLCLILG